MRHLDWMLGETNNLCKGHSLLYWDKGGNLKMDFILIIYFYIYLNFLGVPTVFCNSS